MPIQPDLPSPARRGAGGEVDANPHADDLSTILDWVSGAHFFEDDLPIETDLGLDLYTEIAHLRDVGLMNESLAAEIARLESELARLNRAATLFPVAQDDLLAVAELGAALSAVGIIPLAILTHILARYPQHTGEIMTHLSNFPAWETTLRLPDGDAPLSPSNVGTHGCASGEG